jgi:hypothetical protein
VIIDVNNTKLDETKKREQTRDSSNAMGAFEMRNENEAVSTLVENKVVTTLAKPMPDLAPRAIRSGSGLARWLTIDIVKRALVAFGD